MDVTILTARQSQEPLVKPDVQVTVRELPASRYFGSLVIAPFYTFELLRGRYDAVVTFFADFGECFCFLVFGHWGTDWLEFGLFDVYGFAFWFFGCFGFW